MMMKKFRNWLRSTDLCNACSLFYAQYKVIWLAIIDFTSHVYSWDGLFLGHGVKLDLTLGYKVCPLIWRQRNQLTLELIWDFHSNQLRFLWLAYTIMMRSPSMEEDMCNVLQQRSHLCLPFYASLAGALKHVCLTTMCRGWT